VFPSESASFRAPVAPHDARSTGGTVTAAGNFDNYMRRSRRFVRGSSACRIGCRTNLNIHLHRLALDGVVTIFDIFGLPTDVAQPRPAPAPARPCTRPRISRRMPATSTWAGENAASSREPCRCRAPPLSRDGRISTDDCACDARPPDERGAARVDRTVEVAEPHAQLDTAGDSITHTRPVPGRPRLRHTGDASVTGRRPNMRVSSPESV
jgi:hypothetical protein